MHGSDLSIKIRDGRFNYRVGAIILEEGRLLAVRNSGETHYYTVGGRVRFGESAQEAVIREAHEETGLPLEIDRLLFVHENFFEWGAAREPCHELALFFLMKQHEGLRMMKRTAFTEPYGEASLHWLCTHDIGGVTMYPPFLGGALRDMPHETVHYITKNGVTVKN